MVTQNQIEARNFTLLQTLPIDVNNPDSIRNDYLAIGTNIFDLITLIRLRIYDDGRANITDYYNNAFISTQHYFMGTIESEADLDLAIESIDYTLTVLDLDDLNDYA